MTTLPLETGIDSTKEAMIQPTAGTSAPLTARMPHPASRHVTSSATQNARAASGTGPATRLYWKLPIVPSTAPSRNSTP
jgi:hypothetical protein